MRQRREDQLRFLERCIVGGNKGDVASAEARTLPAALIRCCEREVERGVTRYQCAKLAAGVSAGPEHSHWYFIHRECIIMQSLRVNRFVARTVRWPRNPSWERMNKPARKTERHAAILKLIGAQDVGSQEELRRLLSSSGVSVTQATLSRDLRELGIVRVPGDDGARYALPETLAGEAKPSLETMLPQLFSSIDGVGELIVLHTLASGAQPISEAIDSMGWHEVLGTVAGENTILLICRSVQARQEVTLRLTAIARGR